jgi:hypothetical protein
VEPLSEGGHRVTFQVQAWDPSRGVLFPRGRMVAQPV